jgi:hypothetical protein
MKCLHAYIAQPTKASGVPLRVKSKRVLAAVAGSFAMNKIKVLQVAHDHDLGTLYLDDKGRVWYREIKTYGEYPAVPETVVRWQQLPLPDEPTTTTSRSAPRPNRI